MNIYKIPASRLTNVKPFDESIHRIKSPLLPQFGNARSAE